MSEKLMGLFEDTLDLISRYGNCMVKDHDDIAEECWKDVLKPTAILCDMAEKQTIIHETFQFYSKNLETLSEEVAENANDDIIQRFNQDIDFKEGVSKYSRQNKLFLPFLNVTKLLGCDYNQDSEDDEVAATTENVNVIDPITKLRLFDPVRNSTCDHVYERSAILQLLENKRWIRCPIPGCPYRVAQSYLVTDLAMKAYLKKNQ